MAKILSFPGGRSEPPDNNIALKPIRFRRAEWATDTPIQCGLHQAAEFEHHRQEVWRPGHGHIQKLPAHIAVTGGAGVTLRHLFKRRSDAEAMRQVYFLAALMETIINLACPILRTDLIRNVYQRIHDLSAEYGVQWHGHSSSFLLALPPNVYPPNLMSQALAEVENLQVFYDTIRREADAQFDLIARHFIFYVPPVWLSL